MMKNMKHPALPYPKNPDNYVVKIEKIEVEETKQKQNFYE